MMPPEKCLKDQCRSPTACNGFGYCRERNMVPTALEKSIAWQRHVLAVSRNPEQKARAQQAIKRLERQIKAAP